MQNGNCYFRKDPNKCIPLANGDFEVTLDNIPIANVVPVSSNYLSFYYVYQLFFYMKQPQFDSARNPLSRNQRYTATLKIVCSPNGQPVHLDSCTNLANRHSSRPPPGAL